MSKSILFVRSKIEPPCFKAVRQAISQSAGIEMVEATNFAEATMIFQSGWVGLVVLTVSGKDELSAVVNFLVGQSKLVKVQRSVRVVVFNSINNSKVFHALANLGCAEVIDFKVGAKAVLLKLERHLKLIRGPKTGAADADGANQGSDAGSKKERDNKEASGSKSTCEVTPALAHPADYWLIHGKPAVKRIRGRWLVEMIGPGPSAGQWAPIPLKSGGQKGDLAFQWKVRDPQGKFQTPQGRWVFIGREVEFIWRENRWRFVGDRVSLSFHEGERITARRFHSESADLLKICANSETAVALASAIEETFGGSLKESQVGKKGEEDDADSEYSFGREGPGSEMRAGRARRDRDAGEAGREDSSEDESGDGLSLDDPGESGTGGKAGKKRSAKRGDGVGRDGAGNLGEENDPEGIELDDADEARDGKALRPKARSGEHDAPADAADGAGDVGSLEAEGPGLSDDALDAAGGGKSRDQRRSGKKNPGKGRGNGEEAPKWNDSSSGASEDAPDWNDGTDTPDPDAPAFNDHGARPQNIFNFGRGLGQGHGKTRILYEKDEYETGADAFKPVGIRVTLDSVPATVIEDGVENLKLQVSQGGFQPRGDKAQLEVLTQNLAPEAQISASVRVLKVEPEEGGQGTVVDIEIDEATVGEWAKIQEAIVTRQMSILHFLKAAKGA